jgi:hypothetical protein
VSDEWFTALKAVVERIGQLADDMTALRSELRVLAHAILRATDEPALAPEHASIREAEPPSPPEPSASEPKASEPLPAAAPPTNDHPTARPQEEQPSAPAVPEQLPPRTAPLGAPAAPLPVELPPRGAVWTPTTDDDLAVIEQRCRLKAEATRWCLQRRQMQRDGAARAEIEPRDQEIIRRAKMLPDCFLWMIHASDYSVANLSLYGNLAGCFDTLAAGVGLMRELLAAGNGDLFERCLNLLAEAQSALWTAGAALEEANDLDQKRIHDWLRGKANQRHIFIPRFMRAEDRADPAGWERLLGRIESLARELQENRKRDSQRKKLFGKIRYELNVIATQPPEPTRHWQTIASAIDALVKDGMPVSNRELRELLVPVCDDIPEVPDMPSSFQAVLRDLDRYLASQPAEHAPPPCREPAAEVRQAARLLQDRSVVLIGGNQRPNAKEALKKALGLKELYWVQIEEYQSLATFEPYIARPDVAVVLLAIRWSRHSFGEVQQFCERYEKPLVRLPAGYNPNQVAAQILGQCSDRLAARMS